MHIAIYAFAAMLWVLAMAVAFCVAMYGIYWLVERRERFGRVRRGFTVEAVAPGRRLSTACRSTGHRGRS